MTKQEQQGIRLERLLGQLNLNQSEFSRVIKVSPSLINQIVKGQKALSHRVLSQLTNSYSQVNANWLLNGDGDMLITPASEKKYDVQPGTLDPHVMEEGEKYEKRKEGLWEAVLRRLEELESRVKRLEEGKEE